MTLFKSFDQIGEWVEDNRRVFFQQFKGGLNQTYVQMIPLNRFDHYQVGVLVVPAHMLLNSIEMCLLSQNSFSMSKPLTSIRTIGFSVATPLIFMSTNDIGKDMESIIVFKLFQQFMNG